MGCGLWVVGGLCVGGLCGWWVVCAWCGLCKGRLFSEWVTSTCVNGLWVGCLWGVGCGCGKVEGERSVLPRRLRAVVIKIDLCDTIFG